MCAGGNGRNKNTDFRSLSTRMYTKVLFLAKVQCSINRPRSLCTWNGLPYLYRIIATYAAQLSWLGHILTARILITKSWNLAEINA